MTVPESLSSGTRGTDLREENYEMKKEEFFEAMQDEARVLGVRFFYGAT